MLTSCYFNRASPFFYRRVIFPLFFLIFPLFSLNFTCYNVLRFTCNVHCLGFVERYNTSVILVRIFIPARPHAVENRSSACWKLCWDDASSTKLSAKSKRLILQLLTMTPSSTRLWLSSNSWDQWFSTPVPRAAFGSSTLCATLSSLSIKRLIFV